MAVKKTGFRGYTTDSVGSGYDIDAYGRVKRCIMAINYPYQVLDINFTISNNVGDWGAQMGDGSIIPLSNPVVIYQNKDNAIVQFSMDTPYPSNSPCLLVCMSDTARMTTTPINELRGFVVNSVSGQFAFTTNKYGSTSSLEDGYVDRLIATIHYFHQIADADFSITTDPSHWGVRMGNGTIINLRNPSVIAVNDDSAVVVFNMDTPYPSNSPGILVYRSEAALYTVTPRNGSSKFVAVSDISLPITSIISGTSVDLSCAEVLPYDSTNVHIDWTVVSGDATMSGTELTITGTRNVRLTGTIVNGVGTNRNFSKSFDINVVANTLKITTQPIYGYTIYKDMSTVDLVVSAKSDNLKISYQWYKNTTNSIGGSPISGATNSTFTVPNDVEGDFYYYCKISSPGTSSITSIICHITVEVKLTGIEIIPPVTSIEFGRAKQFSVRPIPSGAPLPTIVWTCSNESVLNRTGSTFTAIGTGSSTITASTINGEFRKSLSITVPTFTPATDIQGLPDSVVINKPTTIVGIVVPSTATNKTISWSIADDTSKRIASITENGILTTTGVGLVIVKATIIDGTRPGVSFERVYGIQSKYEEIFVPVTDVNISLDLSKTYPMNRDFPFTISMTPSDATVKEYSCSIVGGSAIIRNNSSLQITSMNDVVTLRVTIPGGSGTISSRSDFVKNFVIRPAEEIIPIESAKIVFKTESGKSSIYLREINETSVPINIETIPSRSNEPNDINIIIKNVEIGTVNVNGETVDDVISWSIISDDNIPASFDNINNKEIHINTGNIVNGMMYKFNYRLVIRNAMADGSSYQNDGYFCIFVKLDNIYIPVNDVELTLPSKPRVFYPILPGRYSIDPITATAASKNGIGELIIDNTKVVFGTDSGPTHVGINIFNPITDVIFHTTEPNPLIEWGYMEMYAYPQTPGKLTVSITSPSCTVADPENYDPINPTKIDFRKNFEVDIIDPFIPVTEITGMPVNVERNYPFKLCPFVESGDGLDSPNPFWDEEEPTNQKITWEIVNDNIDCTIDEDGVIIVTDKNCTELKISAVIDSGIDEELLWYPYTMSEDLVNRYKSAKKDQWGRPDYNNTGKYSNPALIQREDGSWVRGNVKVDYIAEFRISVQPANLTVAASSSKKNAIAIAVTSVNNEEKEIYFYNQFDFSWLCSDVGPDYEIPFTHDKNTSGTYRKADIIKITFTKKFNLDSLTNFARNCINLVELVNEKSDDPNELPPIRQGDSGYEGFLRGCTSFNQDIVIPEGTSGKRALRNFMRDCTSFNKSITLPDGLTGESILHGFLRGCISFNQLIQIPDSVAGKWCLRAFLYGCKSFNQTIVLPANLSGHGCLYDFLTDCEKFNKNISLPDNIIDQSDPGRELCNFMKNCHKMTSTVTIPKESGLGEVSQQTLSSNTPNSDLSKIGVTINGTGASDFLSQVSNNYDVGGWPYTHFKNLD